MCFPETMAAQHAHVQPCCFPSWMLRPLCVTPFGMGACADWGRQLSDQTVGQCGTPTGIFNGEAVCKQSLGCMRLLFLGRVAMSQACHLIGQVRMATAPTTSSRVREPAWAWLASLIRRRGQLLTHPHNGTDMREHDIVHRRRAAAEPDGSANGPGLCAAGRLPGAQGHQQAASEPFNSCMSMKA